MTLRRLLPTLLALMLLSAPAFAQDGEGPPAESTILPAGETNFTFWTGTREAVQEQVTEEGLLWLALEHPESEPPAEDPAEEPAEDPDAQPDPAQPGQENYRVFVNITSQEGLVFSVESIDFATTGPGNWTYAQIPFNTTLQDAGLVTFTYNLTADVYRQVDDELTAIAQVSGSAQVEIQTPTTTPLPPTPGIPTPYLIGAGAAVLLIGGAGAIAIQRRRERDRMNRAPRRSSALRDEALERAALKKPEQRAAVAQQIRQQEQVRERRRELQILDAKKADVLKTIDLLKKRREAGGLTEHQYNTMVAKKQADLTRIEAEIAEMEAADESGGAAA